MEERWFQKEDRWKDRALCVQHRLRDRFRVAIDKHRRRQRSNGYVSSVMERWLQRFRHFRSETLANSSTFYRKRGPWRGSGQPQLTRSPWNSQPNRLPNWAYWSPLPVHIPPTLDGPLLGLDLLCQPGPHLTAHLHVAIINGFDTPEDSVLTQMLQAVAVPIIGNVCHVFMHGLNHVQIYGGEKLQQAFNRPEKTPLITVSNHIASMDDPLVIAALLPSSVLLHARNLRWTLCASDRCFRNPVTSAFFKCVKVLPVSRGEGIYQKGMDVAITKLNRGGWVHIFPEGSRSRDGGKTMGSVKRGAASHCLQRPSKPKSVLILDLGAGHNLESMPLLETRSVIHAEGYVQIVSDFLKQEFDTTKSRMECKTTTNRTYQLSAPTTIAQKPASLIMILLSTSMTNDFFVVNNWFPFQSSLDVLGNVGNPNKELILDADNAPMVVPFVHAGMQEIMPIGATFPRVGKMVTILVGDPIDFKDLRELEQDNNVPRGNLYDAVSSRISDRLMKLKAQVDKLVELRTDKQDVLMAEHFDTGYEEDNRYFRVGFSCQGSGRITMDPTELMGFAARGLFMNQRMKENVQPSKAWNSFWKQSHGSISMLACAN
ncbi:Phospholipid/glycerol acyltransferase [Cynara cardunculus var. scolymus]|uniref:Phospholipid/glycerol acyltransferase n=1 Tax=Cynara cardunculus var. scolymus TaxID=59895 RepID=A0A103V2Z4_CYNCS|nr:Phospholipid/glycerol acyltransferase [Cynara cardunculus var. scolymus]